MKIFLTGATGYIGTGVADALVRAGHTVTGLARSEQAANALGLKGIAPHRGDIASPASMTAAAVAADATIYAGTTNNGSVDQQAVRTLLEAITGTGKRFLYTSGVWVLGDTSGKVADETWPTRPIALVAWRTGVEQLVLQAAQQRVLPIVIRPGLVYGRGAGIPAGFVQSARDKGAAQYVGTGLNHWPAIHVEDLADLYVRAIERATAGALFHAADDSKHTVKEIAEAASFGAGAK